MALPDEILDKRVEFYLGDDLGWVDATGDVYAREPITITRGRRDEATTVDPSTCSMVLNNRGGRYSPRNPRSPYYGKLGRNTPVRVSVKGDESYLSAPFENDSFASTDPVTITGDFEFRIEVRGDWTVPSGHQYFAGQWRSPDDRGWNFYLNTDNEIVFEWTPDGTFRAYAYGILPAYAPERAVFRVTHSVSNGTTLVRIYMSSDWNGPWYRMADVPFDAEYPIYNSTEPLRILQYVSPFTGNVYRAELSDETGVVAAPDFRSLAEGTTEFVDSAGLTWNVHGLATISDRAYRFHGEVSEWPSRWDLSGSDAYTPITASGILRRMGQGAPTLQSTLRRIIPGGGAGQPAPVAYWPMEEGQYATQAASPLDDVEPLRTNGLNWASNDTLFGSDALPTLGQSSSMSGVVPNHGWDGWHVDMSFFLEKLPNNYSQFMEIHLDGSKVARVRAELSDDGVRMSAFDSENVLLSTATYDSPDALASLTGTWQRAQMFSATNGTDSFFYLYWRDVITGVNAYVFCSVPNSSRGRVKSVSADWDSGLSGMAVGHLGVWNIGATADSDGFNPVPAITYFNDADDGFEGESAWFRINRLAIEENLPLRPYSSKEVESTRVGPQRVQSLLELLEEATEADGGILFETLDELGLTYRSRASLYNQEPRLVLDYSAGEIGEPFEPMDDDQGVANDVTVTRVGGSSGRAVLESGPMSVQAPPNGIGRVNESVSLNLARDDQTEPHAYWRMRLGTVDEARYPQVHVMLHASPHLIPDVLRADIMDRMQVINPPEWLPPGDIDLMLDGYTEELGVYTWDITFSCSRGSPWLLGTVPNDEDAPDAARADTAGSVIALDADASATQLYVHTQQGPMWVEAGRVLNSNPDFEEGIYGWDGSGATLSRVPTPGDSPTGGAWSLQIAPTGTSNPNANCDNFAVTSDAEHLVTAWLRCETSRSLRLSVGWKGEAGHLASVSNEQVVAAGEWTKFEVQAAPASGATEADVAVILPGTVTTDDVVYADRVTARIAGGHPEDFPFDVNVGGEYVRATAIAPAATDDFSRDVTDGWGESSTGLVWTTTGGSATDFSVDATSGKGRIHLVESPTSLRFAEVIEAWTDTEQQVTFSVDQLPASGVFLPGLIFRAGTLDGSTVLYWLNLNIGPGGTLALELRNVTTVVTSGSLPGTIAPGTGVHLRGRIDGQHVVGKAWIDGSAEPDWQVDFIMPDGGIPAGSIGIAVASTDTTTPMFMVDDYRICSPQEFTVERGINGFTRSHGAGTDVRLAHPAYVAL